ncbi:MAG: putative DNA binding domain-containing protein [Muribaculaceae bacterium]|nr:putative DNA binding domain-containing protein [Muribaculaceae bacterium]
MEFKEAKHDYPFAGGKHTDPKDRRKCVLGYIVALANEKGGMLVLGMHDKLPHEVVGSDFAKDETGQLEDEIYKRLYIRVHCEELFDKDKKRVLVIHVPPRPIGKALRFEGVPLMRVGESLREMDDQEYFSILQEQDPDFSARICTGLAIEDLSEDAIHNMRERLFAKRSRSEFLNKPIEQLLSDLQLFSEEGLNYAALILLGKPEAIRKYLPQNNVVVEYRVSENQLRYSARQEFCEPLFTGIDKIWSYLNQPATNPLVHVNAFPQVLDVPSYTEETVREGILNSIQHRNFQMGGDILVKISPESLVISNTGGFPYGVNIGNILTVNSAPRSRRLAEVIEKAGLIERSGQGVDIMFANCISEGRNLPDYSFSDDFQVTLRIESNVINTQLRKFINEYQAGKEPQSQLNVFDLLTIYSVVRRESSYIYERSIQRLTQEGVVINHPKYGYIMGDIYFEKHPLVENGSVDSNTCRRLYYLLEDGPKAMSSFQQEWGGELTQKQIRTKIEGLVGNILSKTGKNRGTLYSFVNIG